MLRIGLMTTALVVGFFVIESAWPALHQMVNYRSAEGRVVEREEMCVLRSATWPHRPTFPPVPCEMAYLMADGDARPDGMVGAVEVSEETVLTIEYTHDGVSEAVTAKTLVKENGAFYRPGREVALVVNRRRPDLIRLVPEHLRRTN
ncbi:MAG: hypothetical protein AAF909_01815 [Pseudomonadota bacterium]